MRSYELAYIAHPELDEQALEALDERVRGWIEAAGGKIEKIDRWGKRKLAYPINKQSDGYYYILTVDLPPQAGAAIEQDLRLTEPIMRYLLTLQESP
jgi:small subunit ribosomal protein S6